MNVYVYTISFLNESSRCNQKTLLSKKKVKKDDLLRKTKPAYHCKRRRSSYAHKNSFNCKSSSCVFLHTTQKQTLLLFNLVAQYFKQAPSVLAQLQFLSTVPCNTRLADEGTIYDVFKVFYRIDKSMNLVLRSLLHSQRE